MDEARAVEMLRSGVAKVVDGNQLEVETSRGWRVAQVLKETVVNAAVARTKAWDGNYDREKQVSSVDVYLPQDTHRYLLFCDEGNVLAETTLKLECSTREYNTLAATLREAQRLLVARDESLNAERVLVQSMKQNYNNQVQLVHERDARLRAMEVDLAKIRRAIGEVKMKEILAEPGK